MPSSTEVDRSIATLAMRQHGVFTRKQAVTLGATNTMIHRRLARGRWDRVHDGVYRLAGNRPTWHQSIVAACLAWGSGSLASHHAAGALWTVPGFEPGPVELIVPRERRRRNGPGRVHRPRDLARSDATAIEGIPVTTPSRTLLDIASLVSAEILEDALDDVLRRKLVTIARLQRRIEASTRQGRAGIALIRDLVEARSGAGAVTDSSLETRMLRLIRRAKLPRPEIHYRVMHQGRLVAEVDFAYPDRLLAIECDGYVWHTGRRPWQRDLARRNALTKLGWRILHVTWDDIEYQPDRIVATIRSAYDDLQ